MVKKPSHATVPLRIAVSQPEPLEWKLEIRKACTLKGLNHETVGAF
jgi:hypothetical protein